MEADLTGVSEAAATFGVEVPPFETFDVYSTNRFSGVLSKPRVFSVTAYTEITESSS
jgi:hypothetical protein